MILGNGTLREMKFVVRGGCVKRSMVGVDEKTEVSGVRSGVAVQSDLRSHEASAKEVRALYLIGIDLFHDHFDICFGNGYSVRNCLLRWRRKAFQVERLTWTEPEFGEPVHQAGFRRVSGAKLQQKVQ